MRTTLPGILLILLLPLMQATAQPTVVLVAELESSEVVEGARFQVIFTLHNAEAKRFRPPDFKGFKPVGAVSEMSGTTITNGKVMSRYMWIYTLEAGKAGSFTIGPARAELRGRTLQSEPLTLRVAPSGRQPQFNRAPPDQLDEVFLVGEPNRDTAYVGQQLIYRIVLYTLRTVSGPDLVDMPEADKAYTAELSRFDARVRYEKVNGKQYVVKTLYEMAVFPQSPGPLRIDEARIKVEVEQPGALGALLGAKPVLLSTAPVVIAVKPLPLPAPEGFTGGVGHFDWEISTDRTDASTDDAITLTVNIGHNGDARRFSAPVLRVPGGIECADPRLREEETYENGEELASRLSIDYILLPHQAGEYEIVPKLVYFDPDDRRYVTLSPPEPLHFNIIQGTASIGMLAPTDSALNEDGRNQPLYRRFRQLLTARNIILGILAGMLLLAVVGWWYTDRRKKRKNRYAAPPAALHFQRGAAVLPGIDDPLSFYEQLYRLLQYYFGTQLGIDPAGWSNAEVENKLRSKGISAKNISAVTGLLDRCEQVLYAGQANGADMEADRRLAQRLLRLF